MFSPTRETIHLSLSLPFEVINKKFKYGQVHIYLCNNIENDQKNILMDGAWESIES